MTRLEKASLLEDLLKLDAIDENDQAYHEIMRHYIYGEVYQHGSLDLKLRSLILMVVHTTNHTLKALAQQTKSSLACGLTAQEIKEAVYQCTPYVGYGKVAEALEVINHVFEDHGIVIPLADCSTVEETTRFNEGLKIQVATFGNSIYDNHRNVPKELKHIQNYLSAHCFGDFYTRKGLNGQTRELLTFVMIATLGGCENQLRAHVQGNLNMGNNREFLLEVITQCQPYIGFPRTLNAISIINELTGK